jgi:hypothetical protein
MTRLLSLAVFASLPLLACMPNGDAAISAKGFSDNFNRKELGDMWNNTGGGYSIRDNQLHIRGARNKPLWLKRKLPRDVRIEFDVTSDSPEGDIKVEVFGDGKSKAESVSYTGHVLRRHLWRVEQLPERHRAHGRARRRPRHGR